MLKYYKMIIEHSFTVSKSSEDPQLIPTTINYDSDESNTADEIVEEIRKEIGFKVII